jgi:hypothetical protein
MAYAAERPGAGAVVAGVTPTLTSSTGWLGLAGAASLGAGAVHAAAIGVHSEHRQAALTFMVLATVQLAWGALALVRGNRAVAVLGVGVNVAAVAGWAVAKTVGLTFIDGLDSVEPIQTADGIAAGLALASLVIAAGGVVRARLATPLLRGPMTIGSILVTVITMFGMVAAGSHPHAEGEEGHSHGTEVATGANGAAGAAGTGGHSHSAAAVAATPYDPKKPIDLSGVAGVTPEQQAAAENLVAVTLLRLPRWSDPAVAEAAGFRSIGDGFTGVEHFVNSSYMTDEFFLDPDHPESLVFDTTGGGRRHVAPM